MKDLYTPEFEAIGAQCAAIRESVGLSQRAVAKQLGFSHSEMDRIEHGQRRVGLLEFYWLCKICKKSPEKEAAKLMRQLKEIDNPK